MVGCIEYCQFKILNTGANSYNEEEIMYTWVNAMVTLKSAVLPKLNLKTRENNKEFLF